MSGFLLGSVVHAAAAAATLAATPLAPDRVLTQYGAALAALHEPSTFTVDYTLEQTGARALEQTHRIFRRGADERDEIIAVNGTRATNPSIRIFRGHAYRYAVLLLAPRAAAYTFTALGSHRDGHHLDYDFRTTFKGPPGSFTVTRVSIDGVSFLPTAIVFATAAARGRGAISFAKVGPWWVATGASAAAQTSGGTSHERLSFANWRFPASLPPSTFAIARPLPSPPSAPG